MENDIVSLAVLIGVFIARVISIALDIVRGCLHIIENTPSYLFKTSQALTWPVVVVAIILFFRAEFKILITKLSEKISSLTKFSTDGAEFSNSQKNEEPNKPDEILLSINQVDQELYNVVPKDQLDPVIENYKGIVDKKDKSKRYAYAMGLLALLNLAYSHEKNYRLLYGSQLRVLSRLKDYGKVSFAEVKVIYDKAASDYPDFYKNYPFDRWIGFIKQTGLCIEDKEGLIPTPFNNGFLKYLFESNMTLEKYL